MNKNLKTKLLVVGAVLSLNSAKAATLSLSGNYRFGTNLYSNLDLRTGVRDGSGNTATFWENRILIRPDILIDDRFTIKSEVSLLNLGTSAYNSAPPEFGTTLDRTQNLNSAGGQLVDFRKAYLEWASDWGLFRMGRQPKNWGLGIMFDSGADPLNDFSTTVDRVGFQALIGNLGLNLGFEKAKEGLVNLDSDDGESYELSLDYTNPESLLEVGLLYIRNIRAATSGLGLNSSHDFSIYSTRRWGQFQLGAEMASVGQDNSKSQIGALLQMDYMPGDWTMALDFAFASGSAEGQYAFNPNYQPFMILFRETIGPSSAVNEVRGGQTGSQAFGKSITGNGGNGAFLFKGRVGYAIDKDKLILGSDFGFASLVRTSAETSKNLGFELDLHLKQKWYKNFYVTYGLGTFFPGGAFGEGAQTTWGFQLRGVLTF
jgi:hypothetical protein